MTVQRRSWPWCSRTCRLSFPRYNQGLLVKYFLIVYFQVRAIRAYGSAGINLAYLAMGAVDSYFDSGFHIWDYAAPLLIVAEAGGVAMDITGGKVDYLARRMLAASSKELASQILPNITTVKMERD